MSPCDGFISPERRCLSPSRSCITSDNADAGGDHRGTTTTTTTAMTINPGCINSSPVHPPLLYSSSVLTAVSETSRAAAPVQASDEELSRVHGRVENHDNYFVPGIFDSMYTDILPTDVITGEADPCGNVDNQMKVGLTPDHAQKNPTTSSSPVQNDPSPTEDPVELRNPAWRNLALNVSSLPTVWEDRRMSLPVVPRRHTPSFKSPISRERSVSQQWKRASLLMKKSNAVPATISNQILGTVMAALTHLAIGAIGGYPGVTLDQLTDLKSDDLILIGPHEALFASLVHISSAIGCICSGVLQVKLGQRTTLLSVLPLGLGAWLALAFSNSIWLVHLARVVQGLVMGVMVVASNNYVVEIAHSSLRGRLTGCVDITRQIGYLFVYAIGYFEFPWRYIAVLCAVTAIPPFLGLWLLPQSPRWLASQGRIKEAHSALKFYRGEKYDTLTELNLIKDQLDSLDSSDGVLSQVKMLKKPIIIPAFIFLAFFLFTSQFTGNFVILTYSGKIFKNASASVTPKTSLLIIGLVRVLGTFTYICISDSLGRKTSMIGSLLLCAPSLGAMGGYFFLKNGGSDVSLLGWLPLTATVSLAFFICIALPVMSMIPGELLPTSVRALGTSILFLINSLGSFCVSHTYPSIKNQLGQEGAFWIYGIVCVILAFVAFFVIPETKGRELEEISQEFCEKFYSLPSRRFTLAKKQRKESIAV